MNTYWEKFKQLHKGEYFAREAFEDFCYELLDYHYPGREIISNNELEKCDKDALNVVFLAKYFTDELNNSRKGQIRKSFKKFLDYALKEKIKIYAWVLCVPYTLSDEEMKWWLNWKDKTSKQYTLNIQFFDGDYLVELSKKYSLYNSWFTEKEKVSKEEKEEEKEEEDNEPNEENIIFELNEETEEEVITTEKNTRENQTAKEKNTQQQEDFNPNEQQEYIEKITYESLKKEYDRIIEKTNKFSKEEIKELKKISSLNDPFGLFKEIEDLKKFEDKPLRLFYKAKSNYVHDNFVNALKFIEVIINSETNLNLLNKKKNEIIKLKNECIRNIKNILLELEADIDTIQKNLTSANAKYTKASELRDSNKKLKFKQLKTKGDLIITNIENEPNIKKLEEAEKSYSEAYKIDKNNEEIKENYTYAKKLKNAVKFAQMPGLNILSAINFALAYSVKPNPNLKKLLSKSINKATLNTSIALIILVLLFFVTKVDWNHPKVTPDSMAWDKFIIAQTPGDIAEKKADLMLKNLDLSKIHLIDTIINTYKRAMYFGKNDKAIAAKYKKALNIKKEYIANAQANILKNKGKYFISMRHFSEGLQLFKYRYDTQHPEKGKYGYVDTMMNIVIPPVYDFDYERMYKGTENFNNGLALVYLKINKKRGLYMKIDKHNRIKQIIFSSY